MAWPGESERDTWDGELDAARMVYATVAQTIRGFEPVTLLSNPEDAPQAQAWCGRDIPVVPFEHHESWIRDTGPSFLRDEKGRTAGVCWRFNAWGNDAIPSSSISQRLLRLLNLKTYQAPLILEGGAFCVDGQGTLLTTEACVLTRNPSLTKTEIETLLSCYSGCSRIVWLGQGYHEDDTGGHIDAIACFVAPGIVLLLECEDPADENYRRFKDNLKRLEKSKTAANASFEIITIPQPPPLYHRNKRLTLSYINYYISNGGLIAPIFRNPPTDDAALRTYRALYPERRVVPLEVLNIVRGGGGLHCITLAQPA